MAFASTAPHYDHRAGQGRIEALESLRGLAALLVVLYHLPRWNPILDTPIINNGYLMVDLFFVLSGFVIYRAYGNHLQSLKAVARFQFLRLGRLYPVHFLFLMVFVGIELSKWVAQRYFGLVSPNTQPLGDDYVIAFIEQLFLVQAIGPTGNATTFNGPAWSISVEFYTYLIFGLISLWARSHQRLLIALFLALIGIPLWLLVSDSAGGFSDLLRCLLGFFSGCVTAYAVERWSVKYHTLLPWIISITLLLFLYYKPEHHYDEFIYPISAILIASIVFTPKSSFNHVLEHSWLTALGALSYAIYMSHWSIIWVANQIVRVILKRPEAIINGCSVPQQSLLESLVTCAIVMSVVIGISALVYQYLETPWRMKSRKLVSASYL